MDEKANKIVEKVSKLYLEYGIKSITMDDVAHHIAISKKTLYQHFKDKKELVWAVLEHNDCEKKINMSIKSKQGANAIDELFLFYDIQVEMIKGNKPTFVYDLKKYYPEIFIHFQKIKHKRILKSIVDNLAKGKLEGLYRKDLNEDIISRLGLMRIEGIMNSAIFTAEEIVSTYFFSEIFKYNLFGIVSDKGRELLKGKFNLINQ